MTKIIAEIGINWDGNLQTARNMILLSKLAGADYVKFQMFDKNIITDSIYYHRLNDMILDSNNIKYLIEQAKIYKIKIGVSVMYKEGFEILNQLDTKYLHFIKIRCKDNSNKDIAIPAVKYCNKYNIPLLISSEKIISDKEYFRNNLYNTQHAKYLYCIPKYPAELSDINKNYLCPSNFNGYSNHTPSTFLPIVATTKGLEWIEIHVKRSNKIIISDDIQQQIDANVSLSFNELEEVCKFRDTLKKLNDD